MNITKTEKEKGWSIYQHIPNLFSRRTIDSSEFNKKMGQIFQMNKADSFKLIKEMKEQDIIDYQKNKGRLLFRR